MTVCLIWRVLDFLLSYLLTMSSQFFSSKVLDVIDIIVATLTSCFCVSTLYYVVFYWEGFFSDRRK